MYKSCRNNNKRQHSKRSYQESIDSWISPLAQAKLDFVAEKVETISISQKKLAKQYYKK